MVIVSVLIACLYKAPEDISVKKTAMHLFLKGLSNKIFLSFAPVILEILISRLELIPLILISFAKSLVANLKCKTETITLKKSWLGTEIEYSINGNFQNVIAHKGFDIPSASTEIVKVYDNKIYVSGLASSGASYPDNLSIDIIRLIGVSFV